MYHKTKREQIKERERLNPKAWMRDSEKKEFMNKINKPYDLEEDLKYLRNQVNKINSKIVVKDTNHKSEKKVNKIKGITILNTNDFMTALELL